ncbi:MULTISPECIES: DUF5324 family protein [unclassified Streptomyces]|uniref:DUF5324 family protein n=1 Tax=unclassified Streptomyces TaxID=2593676 RepID=UPI002E0DCE92|nr:DUF5324 family protein [Streptomyces sp. NBC_01197]WSS50442.1 DUF5324 family protein [Streptomyces sp. NBC_01180]
MTRMDSVRAATGTAKENVLHAAEVVAPYAGTAKEQATHYANEARVRLAPKVSLAAQQARTQYDARLAPHVDQALTHVPPKVDAAAQRAAKAARQAQCQLAPRVEQAVAAAQPVREEAAARSAAASAAAFAALRGQVSAKQIQKLVRRQQRCAKAGRLAKGVIVLGVVAGGAFAAWKWWDKQANPDWLVEPPAPTEVADRRPPLSAVDGSSEALDPEVKAKQAKAEEEDQERDDPRD